MMNVQVTIFLIGAYAKYNLPYVWVSSSESLQLTEISQGPCQNPATKLQGREACLQRPTTSHLCTLIQTIASALRARSLWVCKLEPNYEPWWTATSADSGCNPQLDASHTHGTAPCKLVLIVNLLVLTRRCVSNFLKLSCHCLGI